MDEYLAHHGILGQKWGKRNGPPYPLDASDHSASEKKAGWRKSLDKDTEKTDNKKVKSGDSGKVSAVKTKSLDKSGEPKKGLTDEQKRFARNVVIGAAIAGAILGVSYVAGKKDLRI